jgi:hypothetical protein
MRPELETPRYYTEAQLIFQPSAQSSFFVINELQNSWGTCEGGHVKGVAIPARKKHLAGQEKDPAANQIAAEPGCVSVSIASRPE